MITGFSLEGSLKNWVTLDIHGYGSIRSHLSYLEESWQSTGKLNPKLLSSLAKRVTNNEKKYADWTVCKTIFVCIYYLLKAACGQTRDLSDWWYHKTNAESVTKFVLLHHTADPQQAFSEDFVGLCRLTLTGQEYLKSVETSALSSGQHTEHVMESKPMTRRQKGLKIVEKCCSLVKGIIGRDFSHRTDSQVARMITKVNPRGFSAVFVRGGRSERDVILTLCGGQTIICSFGNLNGKEIRPTEQGYEIDGDVYCREGYSPLMQFGFEYYFAGKYEAISEKRKLRMYNPMTGCEQSCDVLYFRKRNDQLNYEEHDVSADIDVQKMKRRIVQQQELLEEMTQTLQTCVDAWGYESALVCTRLDQRYMENTPDYTCQSVVFFRKDKQGSEEIALSSVVEELSVVPVTAREKLDVLKNAYEQFHRTSDTQLQEVYFLQAQRVYRELFDLWDDPAYAGREVMHWLYSTMKSYDAWLTREETARLH